MYLSGKGCEEEQGGVEGGEMLSVYVACEKKSIFNKSYETLVSQPHSTTHLFKSSTN